MLELRKSKNSVDDVSLILLIHLNLLFSDCYKFDSNSPFFVSYFFRQDGRVEFSFSSTDDGDRGQVRLRKVNESTVA